MAASHSLQHGLHFYSLQTGACGDQHAFLSKDTNYKGRENQDGPFSKFIQTPKAHSRPVLWLTVINDIHKMH